MHVIWMWLALTNAHAFSLSPMSVSFEPSGRDATRSFVLDNTGGDKIAVQISMATRQMDLKGSETNAEADDLFYVYPQQLVMGPNEKRTVRVSWHGDKEPKQELAYRIIAEQLPVDTEKPKQQQGAMIKMLLKYVGAIYITPKNAKPALSVASAQSIKNKLFVVVENKGSAHQVLRDLTLKVTADGKTASVSGESLKTWEGQNVLAHGRREFVTDWPTGLPASTTVKAELEAK